MSRVALGALLHLAWRSACSRVWTLALSVAAVALAAAVLLGAERLRLDARSSFASAISGTDLIVGARGSGVQLMLYSVFRTGAPSLNIRTSSVQAIANLPGVAWVVPISLGDSHRGYPVVGTSTQYFTRLRYGFGQTLSMAQGAWFEDLYEAVIGAEVAERLGYRVGQRITLAHGMEAAAALPEHADKPFVVSGILARTGTPVDRSVHISLEAMHALHVDWLGGAPLPGRRISAQQARALTLTPPNVTAAFIGLNSRAAVFGVQRQINAWASEPLMAVLPGVALDELWAVVRSVQSALGLMCVLIALVSLGSLAAVLLVGLEQRRRELAVLRVCGAGPAHIVGVLLAEAAVLLLAGLGLGLVVLMVVLSVAAPWLQTRWGVYVQPWTLAASQWAMLAAMLGAGLMAALIPALRAWRLSLSDGLSPPV